MAYVRNWLHNVWGTKNKEKFLLDAKKYEIIDHIRSNASVKGIFIDYINGHMDHMHCLLSLNADQSLAMVMQLIKGESSFWINRNMNMPKKFEWADEYYAGSVSPSILPVVREYIKNQDLHHKKKTCMEEYEGFMKEYGLPMSDG